MSKAILFLDIDGVLNSREWYQFLYDNPPTVEIPDKDERHFHYFQRQLCPALVKRLDFLAYVIEADIVVCSTWRYNWEIDQLQKLLNGAGLKSATVIGKTRRSTKSEERGQECLDWLKDNNVVNVPVVALDDDSDYGKATWLVKTDGIIGLTDDDVEKAIVVINNQKDLLEGLE